MIKLESAHIEEVRGIRKLDIDFSKQTFAISGPNGSGKSGVIDAIEFGLTGEIGRLAGRGTKGLSVAEHGPHVDKTKFPDAAFVELKVFIPSLGKSATITRKISAPRKPKIVPADPDVKAALEEIADHPEITLSRREILRFILVEPAKRSDEIQAILKLEEIGQTRAALNTAQNKLQTAAKSADVCRFGQAGRCCSATSRSRPFRQRTLLAAVNARRKALSLPEIEKLTADTKVDAGVEAGTGPAFNKQSVLRDLKALSDLIPTLPDVGKAEAAAILSNIAALEADPALLAALQRRSFIEKGLELIDGPDCPLCDHPWGNEDHLRKHLQAKLAKSEQSRKLQDALLKNGSDLAGHLTRLRGMDWSRPCDRHDGEERGCAKLLAAWIADLDGLKSQSDELSTGCSA